MGAKYISDLGIRVDRRSVFWLAFGVTVGALVIGERLRPLRRRRDPAPTRVPRNLTIGLLAAATTAASEAPIVGPAQRWAERRRLGLLRRLPLPPAVRAILGVLLLDYSLYAWHRLNHRVPVLWRFHAVHHIDLDLDSSTGVRFHFGELLASAFFRAAQIIVIGADRRTTSLWQRLLIASVVFHHSNWEMSEPVERRLARVIVTPRMHGIHHSSRTEETNSNYSSLLSCWDRLHRSLSEDVPQAAITIGVAGHLTPDAVTLRRSLVFPFREPSRTRSIGS